MYNFYKDIELAKYNFVGINHQEYGFIAQDIAKTKVGSHIALNLDGGYGYSMGTYVSTLAGALKQAINKIESLEKEITDIKTKI